MKVMLSLVLLVLLMGCTLNPQAIPTQNISELSTQIAQTLIANGVETQQAKTAVISEVTLIPSESVKPLTLSGKGTDVINVEIPFKLAIAHIKGNKASSYFSIKSYDDKGEYLDLLVNTTDFYDGIVPVNFNGEKISRFAIESKGDWSIDILPLSNARSIAIPGKIDGSGNDVLVIVDGIPDLAQITGNEASAYFSVKGYGSDGDYINLLVNTTDPYEGKVIIDKGISILAIASEDEWSINITAR